jgi:hypothetical protein
MERDGDERVRPEEELAALDRRFADELRAEQAAYEELAATGLRLALPQPGA